MAQQEPEQALHDTWARDFDMVIAEEYPSHSTPWLPDLDRLNLTTDRIRLALPPVGVGVAAADDLSTARDLPWVMEPRGTASRHFAEQLCRTHGFEPDVRYETADLQTQIRLVESGNAGALMPDLVWTGRSTICRRVDLPGRPRRVIFTAQRTASRLSPVSRTFRAELERAAASLEADTA
jgi:DNA-binding transcriptional LysR family regulator